MNNCILSTDKFCEIMKELELEKNKKENFNIALQNFCDDGFFYRDGLEHVVINLLQEIMKDKENDWIGYYIYELDFGKEYKDGMVEENNTIIKLKTYTDLYNLLLKNM